MVSVMLISLLLLRRSCIASCLHADDDSADNAVPEADWDELGVEVAMSLKLTMEQDYHERSVSAYVACLVIIKSVRLKRRMSEVTATLQQVARVSTARCDGTLDAL